MEVRVEQPLAGLFHDGRITCREGVFGGQTPVCPQRQFVAIGQFADFSQKLAPEHLGTLRIENGGPVKLALRQRFPLR
jgi:hypothetical protein